MNTLPDSPFSAIHQRATKPIHRSATSTIERILPEQIDPNDALTRAKFIHDVNIMVNPGGRERTEAEFRNLLFQAGLRLACVLAMPGPLAVLEVDPI